ncbi:hypothetical protein PMEGAPR185_10090 [Priestia megaterium]
MCDKEKFPFTKKLVDECDTYRNNSKVNRIEAIGKWKHLVSIAPQIKKFTEFIYQADYIKADKKNEKHKKETLSINKKVKKQQEKCIYHYYEPPLKTKKILMNPIRKFLFV